MADDTPADDTPIGDASGTDTSVDSSHGDAHAPEAPATDDSPLIPIEKYRRKSAENASLRRRLREAEAGLAEQTGEPDEAQLAALVEHVESSVSERTREARIEVAEARVLAAAVRAGWATPEDASRYLDVADLVGESQAQIAERLAEVATDRPHLLAKSRGPWFDQGPRGSLAPRPKTANEHLLNALGLRSNGP